MQVKNKAETKDRLMAINLSRSFIYRSVCHCCKHWFLFSDSKDCLYSVLPFLLVLLSAVIPHKYAFCITLWSYGALDPQSIDSCVVWQKQKSSWLLTPQQKTTLTWRCSPAIQMMETKCLKLLFGAWLYLNADNSWCCDLINLSTGFHHLCCQVRWTLFVPNWTFLGVSASPAI